MKWTLERPHQMGSVVASQTSVLQYLVSVLLLPRKIQSKYGSPSKSGGEGVLVVEPEINDSDRFDDWNTLI